MKGRCPRPLDDGDAGPGTGSGRAGFHFRAPALRGRGRLHGLGSGNKRTGVGILRRGALWGAETHRPPDSGGNEDAAGGLSNPLGAQMTRARCRLPEHRHGVKQVVRVNGLDQVHVEARRAGSLQVGRLTHARQGDEFDR